MVTIKPIVPKRNPFPTGPSLKFAINDVLDEQAQAAQALHEKTTTTWNHKPAFYNHKKGYAREVGTGDKIWNMLNVGTKAHKIRVKRRRALRFTVPFKAKTRPGYVASYGGSKGSAAVFRREVMHPGTEARNWSEKIGAKVDKDFPGAVNRKVAEMFRDD